MKKQNKDKLKVMSIEQLNKELKEQELQLVKAHCKNVPLANPQKGVPTKLIKSIKRTIAVIKTIINQKTQLKESLILCKDKTSKRRERRLRGKMKELKTL